MPVAEARDCSINYAEQGDGVHTVLFLHGLLQSSALWKSLMRGMPSVEFRRLAFDLPGCGGSSPLPDPTIDAMADSVRQALHSMKVERCSVVACGVGGMIAQSLGARYPHIVFKLVITGGRAFALDSKAASAQAERLAELEWTREALTEEIASHYVKRPREKLFQELLDVAEATDKEAACAIAREYARASTVNLLHRMTARTLVLHGAKDAALTAAEAEILRARIPTARLESIDSAGSMAVIEAPRLFKAQMLELLREF